MPLHGEVLRQASVDLALLSETKHRQSAVPRHAHDLASFCLVTRGAVAEITRGNETTFVRSEVIYREPAAPHANAFGRDGARCFNVHVAPSLLQRRENETANPRAASPVLRRMLRELRGAQCPLVLEGLLFQLVGEVFRPRRIERSLVDDAVRIIDERFTSALTVRSIAGELSTHPAHLSHAFREKRGTSIGETVRALRLRYAIDLLRDGRQSLATIALSCGFTDQSHFTKTFRAAVGTSPGKYRNLL